MGISLRDVDNPELRFDVNFWHWHAIVEEIKRLCTLPEAVVDGLHEPFCGNGLSKDQARAVAQEIRSRVLPHVSAGVRILLDGTRTTEPDDGVFHARPEELDQNYSTTPEVLAQFGAYCEVTNGFTVC